MITWHEVQFSISTYVFEKKYIFWSRNLTILKSLKKKLISDIFKSILWNWGILNISGNHSWMTACVAENPMSTLLIWPMWHTIWGGDQTPAYVAYYLGLRPNALYLIVDICLRAFWFLSNHLISELGRPMHSFWTSGSSRW